MMTLSFESRYGSRLKYLGVGGDVVFKRKTPKCVFFEKMFPFLANLYIPVGIRQTKHLIFWGKKTVFFPGEPG